MEKMKMQILPNSFLKNDGTIDKENLELLSGHIAGICYSEEGYNGIIQEEETKTLKRLQNTFDNYHFSVHGHIHITLYIENIPKLLAMVLNNEKEYNTSEKSARYTPIDTDLEEDSVISKQEAELYTKWKKIFSDEIKKEYGDIFTERKIKTLSQENARYMVTVFMPTKMVYTTSFRQLNDLVAMMKKFIIENENSNNYKNKLTIYMKEFIKCLDNLNLIEEKLCANPKDRSLSFFNDNLDKKEEYFGDVYCTNYKVTPACLAQAHRHRTLHYQMKRLDNKEYFIPEILQDKHIIKNEWIRDIESVSDVFPQGELIEVNECGEYDNFILKLEERLCTNAQLEIMKQSRRTLLKYKEELEKKNHYLKDDITKYTNGARCTFPCFNCPNDCKFKEGKTLVRKI